MSPGGHKFLVTAGPTREAIDPVRYLTNHSTGKMGYALAGELAARGAEVTLVSGPTALPVPEGVRRIDVVSAEDMWRECVALWPQMDGAVMCAAVADYTPAEVSAEKIKKETYHPVDHKGRHPSFQKEGNPADAGNEFWLKLKPTKDIAAALGGMKRSGQILVGFALETDNEEANALGKLARKNLDMIVLNSLRDPGAGFGHDTNRITIFDRQGRKTTRPLESKSAAAAHIVDAIAAFI
jgi:phosphopantothenoylcysteine decarboxylase/phosphopantothenate--cysteine ligase